MSQKLKAARKLTDADFIEWSERPAWTANEAIAVLYGYRPERNVDKLIDLACEREALQRQFSELIQETLVPAQEDKKKLGKLERYRDVLNSYRKYDDIPKKFSAPPKWVQRASYGGLLIAREWEVIFPYSFKGRLGVSLQQEPDYREFLDCLAQRLEISTKDLVCYALNIHPDRFGQTPECGNLLAHIYSELWREAEIADIEELRNRKVAVAWFLDHCQAYNHLLDARFLGWQSWFKQHSELANHLSDDELPPHVKPMPPKYDLVLQAAINKLSLLIPNLTIGKLVDYLRDQGADSCEVVFEGIKLDVEGCSEFYLAGDAVAYADSDDIDRDIPPMKLRSLELYIARAKKIK